MEHSYPVRVWKSTLAFRRPPGVRLAAAGLGLAFLAACSATCPAFDPAAEPVVYHHSADPATVRTEEEYVAPDGARLGYVAHRRAEPVAALVYLHGIESHGGWFEAAADGLCAEGFDVYCLDRRGSGINRENRGFRSGHVDRWETLVGDIHAFVEPLRERYEHVFLVGLSWGGKLATVHGLEHPADADGLVLITPGLVAEVDVSFASKLGIFLGTFLRPTATYHTPIEPEMFTRTPLWLDKLREDPLRLHCATARFFWESRDMDKYVDRNVERNRLPVLLFLADGDTIVDNEGIVALLERGGQEELDVRTYEGQTHSIQFDATDRLVADTAAWILARMAGAATP